MLWADIGMGLAIVGFVVIVGFFQDETFFAPLMMAYMAAVVVFAVACEWFATKEDSAPDTTASDTGRTIQGVPLPH
jgi:Na+/melibiose symporter-like transporter